MPLWNLEDDVFTAAMKAAWAFGGSALMAPNMQRAVTELLSRDEEGNFVSKTGRTKTLPQIFSSLIGAPVQGIDFDTAYTSAHNDIPKKLRAAYRGRSKKVTDEEKAQELRDAGDVLFEDTQAAQEINIGRYRRKR